MALGSSLGFDFVGFRLAVDGSLTNTGVIDTQGDGSAGALLIGNGHQFVNGGYITTDGGEFDTETVGPFRAAGVAVVGDDVLVQNSGVIKTKARHPQVLN